jgi:hypothetical protein
LQINDKALYELIDNVSKNRVIIVGDFNFPELDWSSLDNVDVAHPFVENLGNNFLVQHVDKPTRGNNYLDLVLSSDETMINNLDVGETFETSDHQIVRFNLLGLKEIPKDKPRNYDYFKVNYDEVRMQVGSFKWNLLIEDNSTKVDEIWAQIKTDIVSLRNKYVGMKKKFVNKLKWVTKRVTKFRRAKKKAWNNYIKSGKDNVLYNIYKNKLKLSINENRIARCRFEEQLAENIKNNAKSFYSYANSRNRAINKVGPLKTNNDKIINDNTEIASSLNEYFSSVFTVENLTSLPNAHQFFTGNQSEAMSTVIITEDIVLNKLNKINVNKSNGPDEMHCKILYELRYELVKPLTYLFQQSLETSVVPQDWRDANVAPLHKKGSKEKVENYRPISLTSVVGKILESIIKDSLIEHLKQHKLIQNSQHGFISGRSCLTNLLDFFEVVTKELDEGKDVDLVYLDFSKAFDTVPYERLFKKLEAHGVIGKTLNWIKIWLSSRRQRVCVSGDFSEWAQVTSGVPQGSVLGPILFIVYINDLDNDIVSKLGKFADDSKLCKSITSLNDVNSLRQDLATLEKWSDNWQMQFNSEKCSVIHLGNHNQLGQYSINNSVLKNSSNERDLGIIIDQSMKFSEHCNRIVNSANSVLGMIRRTMSSKSKKIIVRLYKSLVRPKLEYCVQAWRPFLRKDIDKLEKVQRRATKMIDGCRFMSYEDRLKVTGLTTLEDRRNRGDIIEVFKMIKGFTKVDYREFFQLADNQKTRGHKFKLVKNRSRLEIRRNFFSQRIVNDWNILPKEVVEAESINSFKNKYDSFVKDRYLRLSK